MHLTGTIRALSETKNSFTRTQKTPIVSSPQVQTMAASVVAPGIAADNSALLRDIATSGQQRLVYKAQILANALDRAVSSPARTIQRRTQGASHVFSCAEESDFYSLAIERLLLAERTTPSGATVLPPTRIIEFGSGDGKPVLDCLKRARFDGVVYGYELGKAAASLATRRAKELGLQSKYQVHHSCFYEGAKQVHAECLISNPPYIPSPDDDIMMPSLRGGTDGSGITKHLLTLGYDRCLLIVSAYSDPIGTLEHARHHGYEAVDFMATPLPFGTYSSEPKVRNWINELGRQGKAFFQPDSYILTCVLFERRRTTEEWSPMEKELIQVLKGC